MAPNAIPGDKEDYTHMVGIQGKDDLIGTTKGKLINIK